MSKPENIITFSEGDTVLDIGETIANAQDIFVFASDGVCEDQLTSNDYSISGQTLTVLTDQSGKRITVVGVDCPEIEMPKVGPIPSDAISAYFDQLSTQIAWMEYRLDRAYRSNVGFDGASPDEFTVLAYFNGKVQWLDLETVNAAQAAQIEAPSQISDFALPQIACPDDFCEPCEPFYVGDIYIQSVKDAGDPEDYAAPVLLNLFSAAPDYPTQIIEITPPVHIALPWSGCAKYPNEYAYPETIQ